MAKQGSAKASTKTPKTSGRSSATAKAAAARVEQQKRERRRVLIMSGVIATVLAVVVGVAVLVANNRSAAPELGDVPAAASSDYGVAVGQPDAPHQVVLYEDFLCPACGAFEAEVTDDLDELVSDGQVLLEYRPFELLSGIGDYSARATNAFAVVLEESGPEAAKAFHDELYADQPAESAEEFPDDDWLVEKAVAAGAEEADVRPGIEGMTMADWVESATTEAQDAGVNSTPTVIVDGEPLGGASIEERAQLLLDQVG